MFGRLETPLLSGVREAPMTWVEQRVTGDGDKRFVACHREPEGQQRSAGTSSSRCAAERAAHREAATVCAGAWHTTPAVQVTFADYVDTGANGCPRLQQADETDCIERTADAEVLGNTAREAGRR
jgi:hypothetical protein